MSMEKVGSRPLRRAWVLGIAFALLISLVPGALAAPSARADDADDATEMTQIEDMVLPSGEQVKVKTQGPPTGRYLLEGPRWPGKSIKYYNALPKKNKNYQKGIKKAIAEWNSRGLPIKFVKAKSKSKAHFVISHSSNLGGYAGLATVGYWGRGQNYFLKLDMARGQWNDVAWVASHELGHILGLGHSTGCSVMSYSAYSDCKWTETGQEGTWRCRLQEKDDLKGAKRLYGGKYKLRKNPICAKSAKSGKVTKLKATAKQGTVRLTWKKASKASKYRIVQGKRGGSCPSKAPLSYSSVSWEQRKSNKASLTDQYQKPGKYCYAVYSVNKDGYVNKKSKATVKVNLKLPTLAVPTIANLGVRDDSDEWSGSWAVRAKVQAKGFSGSAGDVSVRDCSTKSELGRVTGSGGIQDVAWLGDWQGYKPGQSVCLEFRSESYWGNSLIKSKTVKKTVKLPAAQQLAAPTITDLRAEDESHDGVDEWSVKAKVKAAAHGGGINNVAVGFCGQDDYLPEQIWWADGSDYEVLRLGTNYGGGFTQGQQVCLKFATEGYWAGEPARSSVVEKTVTLP